MQAVVFLSMIMVTAFEFAYARTLSAAVRAHNKLAKNHMRTLIKISHFYDVCYSALALRQTHAKRFTMHKCFDCKNNMRGMLRRSAQNGRIGNECECGLSFIFWWLRGSGSKLALCIKMLGTQQFYYFAGLITHFVYFGVQLFCKPLQFIICDSWILMRVACIVSLNVLSFFCTLLFEATSNILGKCMQNGTNITPLFIIAMSPTLKEKK